MNYLVTGAAGFIGAAVAERLMNEGHTCKTIDNLSTGAYEHISNGCEFIPDDISMPEVIDSLKSEHFDAIIYMAGQSSGEISFNDLVYDLHTNTQ